MSAPLVHPPASSNVRRTAGAEIVRDPDAELAGDRRG
jgi:hypothetical protein